MEDDEISDAEIKALRPNPKYVALGYFVVRDGEIRVTPKGLAWLKRIYVDGEQVGDPQYTAPPAGH